MTTKKKTTKAKVAPKDKAFISKASSTAKSAASSFSAVASGSILNRCKKSNLRKAMASLL